MTFYRRFPTSPGDVADPFTDPIRIDAGMPASTPTAGPRVSDLPFPYPASDHHRLANALWLLDNNPSGRALLPAEADDATDAPRFAAIAPGTSDRAMASAVYDRMMDNARLAQGELPETATQPPENGPSGKPRSVNEPDAHTMVTLFYRPIHGATLMHSYVVAEGNGEKYYVGAFPEVDLGFASNIGQAALDSAGLRQGTRGRLLPRQGPFIEGVGEDFAVPPAIRVDFQVPRNMGAVKQQLFDFAEAVRKAEIPYDSINANSNSFAHGAIRALGLMPKPVPHLLAPGANAPTILSEHR